MRSYFKSNHQAWRSNDFDRINYHQLLLIYLKVRSNIINPESRSIFAGGVGWVRSTLLEFGDGYLHKPTPTDPIPNTIEFTIH
jgi:hypothetical protein